MDLSERTGLVDAPRHPWEEARLDLVLELLAGTPAGRVLDVGAGDAFVARGLAHADPSADVLAVDAQYTDADLVQYRSTGVATARSLPPPGDPFDTALVLDVLEHVEHDDALLREIVTRVRPGGRVVVTVPAWPALFSAHDRALGHVRRYRPHDARALLGRAGLDVVRGGGAFFSLVAPRVASLALERAGRERNGNALSDPRMHGPLGRAVGAVLRWDTRAAMALSVLGIDAPGLTFFALCRRPS